MAKIIDCLSSAEPSLFIGIVDHLWQSSVAGLAVLGLLALNGTLSARARRTLASLALAKFLVPIAIVSSFGRMLMGTFGGGSGHGAAPVLAATSGNVWAAPVIVCANLPVDRHGWAFVGWIWALGVIFMIGAWTIRGLRLRRRLLGSVRPLMPSVREAVSAASRKMGLRSPPLCVGVETGCGPGVVGVLRPVVILPQGIEAVLAPEELEAILLHEFVHVRCRDPWWNLLQTVLVSAFWFDPVVWLLHRSLSVETEKSCDEHVVAITANPRSYADGILKTVRFALGLPCAGYVGAATPPVTSRLVAILSHHSRVESRFVRVLVLGSGIALLAFSRYAGSFREAAADADSASPGIAVASANLPPDSSPAQLAQYSEGDDTEAPVDAQAAPDEKVQTSTVAAVDRTQAAPVSVQNSGPVAAMAGRQVLQISGLSRPPLPTVKAAPIETQPDAPTTVLMATGFRIAMATTLATIEMVSKPKPAIEPTLARPVEARSADLANRVASASEPVKRSQPADRLPRPTYQPSPVYPFEMRSMGIQGAVVVDFVVDAKGRVVDAHAVSSTRKEFESYAVQGVSRWKFKPATKNGQPVAIRMNEPIRFTLNGNSAG